MCNDSRLLTPFVKEALQCVLIIFTPSPNQKKKSDDGDNFQDKEEETLPVGSSEERCEMRSKWVRCRHGGFLVNLGCLFEGSEIN